MPTYTLPMAMCGLCRGLGYRLDCPKAGNNAKFYEAYRQREQGAKWRKTTTGEGSQMAIFHIDFKILKRSEGKSSLYLSAYNSRMRLKDEKTGLVFNYEKKKEDLMHSDILLPKNAPESFKNRSVLWNEVEKQKRKDSQLARTLICALPRS